MKTPRHPWGILLRVPAKPGLPSPGWDLGSKDQTSLQPQEESPDLVVEGLGVWGFGGLGVGFGGLGECRVQGLGFRALGFGVRCSGFRAWRLGVELKV